MCAFVCVCSRIARTEPSSQICAVRVCVGCHGYTQDHDGALRTERQTRLVLSFNTRWQAHLPQAARLPHSQRRQGRALRYQKRRRGAPGVPEPFHCAAVRGRVRGVKQVKKQACCTYAGRLGRFTSRCPPRHPPPSVLFCIISASVCVRGVAINRMFHMCGSHSPMACDAPSQAFYHTIPYHTIPHHIRCSPIMGMHVADALLIINYDGKITL